MSYAWTLEDRTVVNACEHVRVTVSLVAAAQRLWEGLSRADLGIVAGVRIAPFLVARMKPASAMVIGLNRGGFVMR